jgi:hypothetical protein
MFITACYLLLNRDVKIFVLQLNDFRAPIYIETYDGNSKTPWFPALLESISGTFGRLGDYAWPAAMCYYYAKHNICQTHFWLSVADKHRAVA